MDTFTSKKQQSRQPAFNTISNERSSSPLTAGAQPGDDEGWPPGRWRGHATPSLGPAARGRGSASPERCQKAGAALRSYRHMAGEARGLFAPFKRSDQRQGPATPR